MALPNPAQPRSARSPRLPGSPASPLDALLRALLGEAGECAAALQGRGPTRRKSDGSPVTEADLAAEAVLVAGLRRHFPADSVLSEEGGGSAGDADAATWLVDPIDGTSAFTEGLPHWGPTVARLERGRVTAGALYLPRLGQYWYVDLERGAFADGEALPPLAPRAPDRADVVYVPSRMHRRTRLDWPGKARNLGSLAAHLALVASGAAAVALVPPGWAPWDTACGLALIGAVGGRAAGLDGDPPPLQPVATAPRVAFAAGNPGAVAWLLQPGRVVSG